MNKIFANFQKYDEKGRRLNIFAIDDNQAPNSLKVVYFPCSKADQFSKARGWELYANHNALMGGVLVPMEETPKAVIKYIEIIDNKPKKSFLNWCNENFFSRKFKFVTYRRETLRNDAGKVIRVKDSPIENKFSLS